MSTATTNEAGFESGAAVGAGVWVVGAVLTFIIAKLNISLGLSIVAALSPIAGTLWAYQAIHSWFAIGLSGFAVFTIIPIVLLIGAGFYVASQSQEQGFLAGAAVAGGYFAVTVLAAVLVLVMTPGTDIAQLLISLVIAGVVFPVVFAGLGGVIADQA